MARKVKLGDKVKERVTGMEGIVVTHAEWLYGCNRFAVEPEKLKEDGSLHDATWFDEQRVQLVEEKEKPITKNETSGRTGGPQNDPKSTRGL